MKTITSGDDTTLAIQLYNEAGAKFLINTTATVKVGIVDLAHARLLVAAVTCNRLAAGADWTTSLVIATFTAAQTAVIVTNEDAYLEIEVLDTIKTTYFERVKLTRGLV